MSDANATIESMTSMNEELSSTIVTMEAEMSDANATIESITSMNEQMNTQLVASEATNETLSSTITTMEAEMSEAISTIEYLTLMLDELTILNTELSLANDSISSPILIDLLSGWNIIGYTFNQPQDVVASFEEINSILSVVKNNSGEVYWPEFGYNGIGDLIPGQGYQVRVLEDYDDFVFENVNGLRIDIQPMVPDWAIDMDVFIHPNDIRSLVRVVNYLGQEVDPNNEFKGALLYYLYNDGTVEKHLN